jgi:hypothetical protein
MRRFQLLLFLAPFAVAACDGGGLILEPPAPPGPTAQVRVGFPAGGVADTIVVTAVERLPLRAAELLAPDGTVTPAGSIDLDASPRFATGQWAAGDPWRSGLAGNGAMPAVALQHAEAGAALHSREQLLATVSSADIALPDPVVYRRDWRRYRIRLTFGTPPGDAETRELAAPEPPR